MVVLLAAHFLAAALAPGLVRPLGRRTFLVLAVVPAASFGWLLAQAGQVTGAAAQQLNETISWVPSIGLDIALRLDTLSWTLAMLVTGVGALVLVYCAWYFEDGDPSLWRFTGAFTAFAGSMLGLVLARNLLLLYVFWELTTVFSFVLIGHNPDRRANRRAAVNALIVTTFGGLAMLVGFIMLGEQAGSFDIDQVVATLGHRPAGTATSIAILLALIGAISKSALVPFHFWLPGAMAAPTPVSAYLHAAAMVKAGVFLAAALAPGFAGTVLWRITLLGLGVLTMLIGGARALGQNDIKLLLAYGTVSQLGFLMAIFGLGTRAAALAGLAMLVAHALFKAALFMTVGIVDHAAHTRDLRKLSGLAGRMPVLCASAVLAAASMAGIPPLLGFVAKESVLGAFTDALGHGQIGVLAGGLALGGLVLGAMLTVSYTLRFVWGTFARKAGVADTPLAATPTPILTPPAVLALAGLLLGFAGAWLTSLFAGYDEQFADDGSHPSLALWHGVTPALILSLVAIAGGIGAFAWQQRTASTPAAPAWMPSAERSYEAVMRSTDRLSVEVTGRTQRGSLPFYLGSILLVVLAVPGTMLLAGGRWPAHLVWFDDAAQAVTCAVMVVAAVLAVRSRRRLKAVLLAGVTGYTTAVLFLLHGAPDLALTQVLVETVTLVLFVLVLRRLPTYFSSRPFLVSRWFRVVLGALSGAFVAGLAAVAAGSRVGTPVSADFADAAVSYGGGRNIVNVTLVDVRAWDTLGEISVLVVAATGVASLIFLITGRGGQSPQTMSQAGSVSVGAGSPAGPWLTASRRQQPEQRSMVFEVVTRLVFHTILLFSVWLLFAGHNAPGGGFAGGLMAGLALMVRYLAGGRHELDEAAPVDAGTVLGAGLLLAGLSAIAPLAFGGQVLQSAVVDLHLPLIGDLHLVTSVFFDIGVYLVVIGVMLDLLRSLGAGIDRDIAAEPEAVSA